MTKLWHELVRHPAVKEYSCVLKEYPTGSSKRGQWWTFLRWIFSSCTPLDGQNCGPGEGDYGRQVSCYAMHLEIVQTSCRSRLKNSANHLASGKRNMFYCRFKGVVGNHSLHSLSKKDDDVQHRVETAVSWQISASSGKNSETSYCFSSVGWRTSSSPFFPFGCLNLSKDGNGTQWAQVAT